MSPAITQCWLCTICLLITGQRFIAAQANHRNEYTEDLLQPYRINEHSNSNNNNNFYPPQLQQNIARPTTTRPIPLWSSAPIVVDYENDYVLQQQQQSQQQQQHLRNTPLRPTPNTAQSFTYYPTPTPNDYGVQSRALLQSFPGEFNARRTFKAFPASTLNQQQSQIANYYGPYQQQQQHFSPERHETPYAPTPPPAPIAQTLHWPASNRRDRELARAYAAHFEHYVRKYPQRLRPIYEPLEVYKT